MPANDHIRLEKMKAAIQRDAIARVKNAKLILAGAEAHKESVRVMLTQSRANLIESLNIINQIVSECDFEIESIEDRLGGGNNQHSSICSYCDHR
jgi:hypothetical protein